MRQAWITGAHGFIGRNLARHLNSLGCQVIGLGHGAWPDTEAAAWGVACWVNGEVSASNLGQLQRAWGNPEVVFHLAGGSSVGAALANPREDFMRTVVSTAELVEWLRLHAPTTGLVAVSSAAVYGSVNPGPITEDARLSPYSPYGTHKLMMEDACRSYAANFGLRVVLPRLFSVFGCGLKKQLLWDLCGKIAAGGAVELGGSGDELRDWIDVRDVAAALATVAPLAEDTAPVINLGSGIPTSVRDVAKAVVQAWFAPDDRCPGIVFSGHSRPGDPFSLVANVERLQSLRIGCSISLDKGIRDYVSWYRKLNVAAD